VALAETEILKCIAEIAASGVTADELDAAKHSYEKDLADLIGSNAIIAGTICRIKALELPADHYDKVLQRVHSLTLSEMNELTARYVSSDNFTRVRVGRV
jgi:predicted Zn-dependent peptidase